MPKDARINGGAKSAVMIRFCVKDKSAATTSIRYSQNNRKKYIFVLHDMVEILLLYDARDLHAFFYFRLT